MMNETDLSRVDLNLLTLFETVMKERHVGRAAERLNLSPSAVSHGLGRLRRLLNDALFVRHPKGLNPTERAVLLEPLVADLLARARSLIGGALTFDPSHSQRHFRLGTVDAIGSVIIPPLFSDLGCNAPQVTIGVTTIFPQEAVAALDAGRIDAALLPNFDYPARMAVARLYPEDFVFAVRNGHPLPEQPSLAEFAGGAHLLVSAEGGRRGFVDDLLERHGLKRHVALTVPSFLWALAVIGETDLIAAAPRTLAQRHAARFGVELRAPPVPIQPDHICLVMPKAVAGDPAMQWLADRVAKASASGSY